MKTADLSDKYLQDLQICELSFQSYGKRRAFHGPIHTVRVLNDNSLVLEALETIPPGSVLVVDGGGSRYSALVGDRLAGIAADRGLAGVIINGCVRDSRELIDIDCGIFALGTMPRRSAKNGEGSRDQALVFGGVTWTPGHYVYADEDGVAIADRPLEL